MGGVERMIYKRVSLTTLTLLSIGLVFLLSFSTNSLADIAEPAGFWAVVLTPCQVEKTAPTVAAGFFDSIAINEKNMTPWETHQVEPVLVAGIEPRKVADTNPHYVVEQTGGIKVTSLPGGAEVKIDDRPAGHTPIELVGLKPGKVKLSVSKDGYNIQEKIANIDPDRTLEVKIELVPSSTVKKGKLTVYPSPNSAQIRILNINPRYEPGMELESGKYQIEVSAPGYLTRTQWVSIAEGDNLQLVMSLDEEKTRVATKASSNYVNPVPTPKASVMSGAETLKDTRTKLMWTAKDNGSDITWNNAVRYCDGLNLGGYRNWRLPTIKELEGLLRDNPELRDTMNLSGAIFWSSTDKNRTAKQYYQKDHRAATSRKTNSFGIRALAVRNYR